MTDERDSESSLEREGDHELDHRFVKALDSLDSTLSKLRACSDGERERLRDEAAQLRQMHEKLVKGRVEIVVFGEISTGKSALINALIGDQVAAVDVQGGWTREVWGTKWEGCGYRVPGFADSEIVVVDTPGINEVGGTDRAKMAADAAQRADLILFVVDSDLNETEYAALLELVSFRKPVILVLNKLDLYDREQRARLQEVLVNDRCHELLPKEQIVTTIADPREVEYVIESADGSTRQEWKKPPPQVVDLKELILQILERDGADLLAVNAAMYASDKNDRIVATRVQMRDRRANQVIWSYAVLKAGVVAWTPWPVVDIVGGGMVDVTMVGLLSRIYGLDLSWKHTRKLVTAILKATGWMIAGETAFHLGVAVFKTATFGLGTALTAIPQGAAGGYASYIVGKAAKYYFEHGASWGGKSPKTVVRAILAETDRESVLAKLRDEINQKLQFNPYARGAAEDEISEPKSVETPGDSPIAESTRSSDD